MLCSNIIPHQLVHSNHQLLKKFTTVRHNSRLFRVECCTVKCNFSCLNRSMMNAFVKVTKWSLVGMIKNDIICFVDEYKGIYPLRKYITVNVQWMPSSDKLNISGFNVYISFFIRFRMFWSLTKSIHNESFISATWQCLFYIPITCLPLLSNKLCVSFMLIIYSQV